MDSTYNKIADMLDSEDAYTSDFLNNEDIDLEEDDYGVLSVEEVYNKKFLGLVSEYTDNNPSNALLLIKNDVITKSSPLYGELFEIAVSGGADIIFTLIHEGLLEVNSSYFLHIFKKKLNHPWVAFNLIKMGLIKPDDVNYSTVKETADKYKG